MHWIAPSEKDTTNGTLERRLWDSADQFRASADSIHEFADARGFLPSS